MKKERILYIMGIDWQWIYQRPHILAEKLAQDYDVTVVFPRSITTRNTKLPERKGMDFRILWTLPYQEKNAIIGKVSEVLNANVFQDVDEFETIFVGYPLYARYIPDTYQGKTIYDCMDNHEALYPDQKRVHRVVEQEIKLIQRCDLLLASAGLLQEKVNKIAGFPKSTLLRNGMEIQNIYGVKQPETKQQYSLGYIGTIGEWFDYNTVKKSLQELENVNYHLIGPANQRVEHERVRYLGSIPHDKLGEEVKELDCLVMPFVVNEIVASVDPVKLYEYIGFGKCIVSVYYPEIERFGEFVYFYKTPEEYIELLRRLAEKGFPPKYGQERQREFLKTNTWDQRYETLKMKMEELKNRG